MFRVKIKFCKSLFEYIKRNILQILLNKFTKNEKINLINSSFGSLCL